MLSLRIYSALSALERYSAVGKAHAACRLHALKVLVICDYHLNSLKLLSNVCLQLLLEDSLCVGGCPLSPMLQA